MAIIFPRPFAFAIDDLGWNEGSNLEPSPTGGPYRCGVKRNFDLKDYQHIVRVGKAIGARIQCLFILSEMDRENVVAKYPTSTYQRQKFDNSHRVCETQKEIMNYVVEASAYMEFGLHGIGHEYWEEGQVQKRAEWYNLIDKRPWPEEDLRGHIECFTTIMAQYGITKENGHTFPESFVPCAYSYYWNPKGNYSLGKLLKEAGVRFANTDFSQIPELNPPMDENGGGFDHGVHVINRINYGNVWHELSSLPKVALADQKTDVIESHWPNWLAPDDFLQEEIGDQWIAYYKSVQASNDRFIAKNTEVLHSQWLYNKYTSISEDHAGLVSIDNTQMPDEVYHNNLPGNMVLKIALAEGQHVSDAKINGLPIAAYFEDEGFGFLYLPPLSKEKYQLTYVLSKQWPAPMVYHDGTYNVYHLEVRKSALDILVRAYGSHTIKVFCDKVSEVTCEEEGLLVHGYEYDDTMHQLAIHISSRDMQGCTATLHIKKT